MHGIVFLFAIVNMIADLLDMHFNLAIESVMLVSLQEVLKNFIDKKICSTLTLITYILINMLF